MLTQHNLTHLSCATHLIHHTNLSHPNTAQILQEHHAELFQLLGKTSGRDVDKIGELKKLGVQVVTEYGLPVLAGALLLSTHVDMVGLWVAAFVLLWGRGVVALTHGLPVLAGAIECWPYGGRWGWCQQLHHMVFY